MFSMYMYNGMAINPAYTGSREALSFFLIGRRQWFGIPGAPISAAFSVHSPLPNNKHAFGGTVINDQISYIGQTWVNVSYAYRMELGNGKLALGLQGTFFNYRINWAKADVIDETDAIPITYGSTLFLPNAGVGAYYSTQKWYAGISVPNLLLNTLVSGASVVRITNPKDNDQALHKRHLFLTGGYVFDLNQDFQIKPSFLMKWVNAAPVEFDVNLNFYYEKKYGFGFSYRSLDGMVVMADWQVNDQFRIGYAYDFPFTRLGLGGFTSGSHELMLWYDLTFTTSAVVSPRIF